MGRRQHIEDQADEPAAGWVPSKRGFLLARRSAYETSTCACHGGRRVASESRGRRVPETRRTAERSPPMVRVDAASGPLLARDCLGFARRSETAPADWVGGGDGSVRREPMYPRRRKRRTRAGAHGHGGPRVRRRARRSPRGPGGRRPGRIDRRVRTADDGNARAAGPNDHTANRRSSQLATESSSPVGAVRQQSTIGGCLAGGPGVPGERARCRSCCPILRRTQGPLVR